MKINPYELVEMRRKIKQYQETGIQEAMKLVKKLRQMNLDPKMLLLTQCPRTLLYVCQRLKNAEQSDPRNTLMRMCKFLYKEWKNSFQKYLKNQPTESAKKKPEQPN